MVMMMIVRDEYCFNVVIWCFYFNFLRGEFFENFLNLGRVKKD